jgi:hypothetical protein
MNPRGALRWLRRGGWRWFGNRQILPILNSARFIVEDYVNAALPRVKSMRLIAPLWMRIVEAVEDVPITSLNCDCDIKLFTRMIVVDILPLGEWELGNVEGDSRFYRS